MMEGKILQKQESSLEPILSTITTGAPNLREAEAYLKNWESQNYRDFISNLCVYLSNMKLDVPNRVLAGVLLKNTLTDKELTVYYEKHDRWLKESDETKEFIKTNLLNTLGAPDVKVRLTAAQVVAHIALIEIPKNMWMNLINILTENIINNKISDNMRQSALDVISFICEDIDLDILSPFSNKILTAVAYGLRPEESNNLVKRSALVALFHILYFCRNNFENKIERDYLMNLILSCTVHPDEAIRVASYEILVEVASVQYDKLMEYMQNIFNITIAALNSNSEATAKQAIEFWSTICDEEMLMIKETEYEIESNQPITRNCQFYIKGALAVLVNSLWAALSKQSEETNFDEWTLAMSSSTCLGLITEVVKDDILPHIVPLIEENIKSQDWRIREAALLGFGAILEGPKSNLKTLIQSQLPYIMNYMRDTQTAVRDTSAWSLGRICKFHHTALSQSDCHLIIRAMGEALNDKPRVAANAAWTLHNMAFSFRLDQVNNPLNTYFSDVVTALINVSDRTDGDEENLRNAAYEALNVVIATAPAGAQNVLTLTLEIILSRLEKSLTMEHVNRDKLHEIQGYLCSVLQMLIHQLQDNIFPHADRIMLVLLNLLQNQNFAEIHDECILAIAAVVNNTKENFLKYLAALFPLLKVALSNWEDYHVCGVAVGLVGDICRATGTQIAPYCDEIMNIFLVNLSNKDLDKSVKPPTLSAIGDIALALVNEDCQLKFSKYLSIVMTMLEQATFTVIEPDIKPDDYELLDYVQLLKVGILEAYIGICQSLFDAGESNLIKAYTQPIVDLIINIAKDKKNEDDINRLAVGLCGDLINLYEDDKSQILPRLVFEWANYLSKNGVSEETRETANWTVKNFY